MSPAGGLLDHSLIVGHIEPPLPHRYDTVMRRIRCWRSFNIDAYMQDVSVSSFVQSPSFDVDELFDTYNSTLISLLDRHVPVRLRRVSVRQSEPWLDADCRAAKRKTRCLERSYRRHHDLAARDAWKTQFQRRCRLFRNQSAAYWMKTIADCHNDTRLLWSKVARLLEPSAITQQPHTANDLSRVYTRVL